MARTWLIPDWDPTMEYVLIFKYFKILHKVLSPESFAAFNAYHNDNANHYQENNNNNNNDNNVNHFWRKNIFIIFLIRCNI